MSILAIGTNNNNLDEWLLNKSVFYCIKESLCVTFVLNR